MRKPSRSMLSHGRHCECMQRANHSGRRKVDQSQGYASTRGPRRLRVIHLTCHAFDSASACRQALDWGPRMMPRTAPIAFVVDDDLEVRSSIQGTPGWPTNNQRETGIITTAPTFRADRCSEHFHVHSTSLPLRSHIQHRLRRMRRQESRVENSATAVDI
jgi:hypothetical protein